MESPQLADLRGRFIRAARTLAGDTGSGPSSTSLSYFRNRGGFCGIAWNDAGITRFQLPTKSATATERMLLRQVPVAKPREPTPEVAEAVASVGVISKARRRIFPGSNSISASRSILRAHLCRGATGRMGAHDNLWGPGQGTRRRTGSRARCRPGHGEESGGADHPLPTGYWRREVRLVVFPRQAARRPRSACSR